MCTLDIHGKPRKVTWTMLLNSAHSGENTITTLVETDWKEGEIIVIASSSWDHKEAEKKIIKKRVGTLITLTSALIYNHYSAIE